MQDATRKVKEELNASEKVNYTKVLTTKLHYLKEVYLEQIDELTKHKAYQSFIKEHQDWVKPYAVFSYLRDLYSTPEYTKWDTYSMYDAELVEALYEDKEKEIAFYVFLQYHLHIQLLEVSNYARKDGVVLKGDLPIGIYRYSVDAWMYPELFHLDKQAGAPPDFYSKEGQNWGFPTYNWEKMREDGYQWWKERLQHMARYFDIYRIDHILGFFRIWQISEQHKQGLMGHFYPVKPIHIEEFAFHGIKL